MKKLYLFMVSFFAAFFMFITPLTAQISTDKKNSQTVLKVGNIISKTKIDKVTVFKDRSLVERVGTISIPAGESRIKIEFLPQKIDKKSVRVSAKGNVAVTIGGVEIFYEHWTPEIIQALKDSIQSIRDRLE
ncbi:DUF4140 domain-containing protein, partial [bacterium]|nr:DUF4140 domain-containing protein [bacterium]